MRQVSIIVTLAMAMLLVPSVQTVRAPNPQDLQSDVLFYGDLREDLSVSAVLEGNTNFPNLDRVYVGFDPNGFLLYDFGQVVTRIRMFPNIDHYDFSRPGDSLSDGCGKEYSMFASADLTTFVEIFTAQTITGSVDPLIYHSLDCSFTTTGSGTLITTYTDGWYTLDANQVIDDYVADFDLNGAYRYLKIRCVPPTVADCDPEIDAVGALRTEVKVPTKDLKCYPPEVPFSFPDRRVILTDKFGNESVNVPFGAFLCTSVLKNDPSGTLEILHWTVYSISITIDPAPITLTDQFGSQTVDATPGEGFLIVPALKNGEGDLNAIHWKCYPMTGTIDPPVVTLTDQFMTETLDPAPAVDFCTPVLKDGVGTLTGPDLICYQIHGQFAPGPVIIQDQFTDGPRQTFLLPANLLYTLGSQAPAGTACTLGFWKNHASTPPWTPPYAPSTTVVSVFSGAASYVPSTDTLLMALSYQGGETLADAARLLLKQAVAALLNAADPSLSYPLTPSQVISMVNSALASGDRDTIIALAEQLDQFNNLGCPERKAVDVNQDRTVNIVDLASLAYAYGSRPTDAVWNPAVDIDYNDIIDLRDLARVAFNYGTTY